jgi:glycosyltransferase involved in cell wall biosynthesis
VRSKQQALHFAWKAFQSLLKVEPDVIYATSVPILSALPLGVLKLIKRRPITIIEWFEIWPLKYWAGYSGFVSGPVGWFLQLMALQIGTFRFGYTPRAVTQLTESRMLSKSDNAVLMPGLCNPTFVPPLKSAERRSDIVFLGRFVDEKQPLLAIESVIEFIKSGWSGNFWVLGQGPSLDVMKAKIEEEPKYAKQIRILENPPDQLVQSHITASFVLLHPSKREGYGLASIEAAYLGTPSLLLNYPNNATVDLRISPELVVYEFTVAGIVEKLRFAHENQAELRVKTLDWALEASRAHSSIATVDYLENLVEVSNGR